MRMGMVAVNPNEGGMAAMGEHTSQPHELTMYGSGWTTPIVRCVRAPSIAAAQSFGPGYPSQTPSLVANAPAGSD